MLIHKDNETYRRYHLDNIKTIKKYFLKIM